MTLLDECQELQDCLRSAEMSLAQAIEQYETGSFVVAQRALRRVREALGIDQLEAENQRLRYGLHALARPSYAPNGVLRSVAYDIVMNSMDGETAAYQIERRTRMHSEKTERLERVLQAADALAAHCERGVNVGPVSLSPATEAALWIKLRNALDEARG